MSDFLMCFSDLSNIYCNRLGDWWSSRITNNLAFGYLIVKTDILWPLLLQWRFQSIFITFLWNYCQAVQHNRGHGCSCSVKSYVSW